MSSQSTTEIKNSLNELLSFIESENYKGYDPYDGLNSPIFKLPIFKSNKTFRFLSQQFIKRSFINFRPILFIKKGCNPVTLGLCIQSYAKLIHVFPEKRESLIKKIEHLISELENLIPEGYSGACWGYDFDWAARYSNIPAYQPTVVATGIITNSLFIAWNITEITKLKELCISASNFVINDLNRTNAENNTLCFSYSPFDKQVVFNANMKGVRLLAQAYYLSKNEALRTFAQRACEFVINQQKPNGAWIYSKSKSGAWVDNYHTGYILDCLDEYIKLTLDPSFQNNLDKGLTYYLSNFIEESGAPKFYDKKTFPIDCTAAGQTLLTLTRFKKDDIALKVAFYMKYNMQAKNGGFFFRKYKYYTNKISFMRWSNAWMLAGLSELTSCTLKNEKNTSFN